MSACVRGAVLDIIVDLRPESPTYLRHTTVELSAGNQRGIYVPERFAHGYQTLEDDTDTIYMVGEFYTPGVEGGLRHDDPALGLSWPLPVEVISEKASRPGSRSRRSSQSCASGCPQPPSRRVERRLDQGTISGGNTMIIVDTALKARAPRRTTPSRSDSSVLDSWSRG